MLTRVLSSACTVLLYLALASHADAQQQTHIVNGQFDTSLNSWQIAPGMMAAWSPEDVSAGAASGSAQMMITEIDPMDPHRILRQCVRMQPRGRHHLLRAHARMVDDPLGQSKAAMAVLAYASNNCSGTSSATFTGTGASGSSWQPIQVAIPADMTIYSFMIVLGIQAQSGMGYPSMAKFDAVHLAPNAIFANGFER